MHRTTKASPSKKLLNYAFDDMVYQYPFYHTMKREFFAFCRMYFDCLRDVIFMHEAKIDISCLRKMFMKKMKRIYYVRAKVSHV